MHLSSLFAGTPLPPGAPDIIALILFKPQNAKLSEFTQAVLRDESYGPLSIGERELVATMTSAMNSVGFCRESHRAVTERFLDEGRVLRCIGAKGGDGLPFDLSPRDLAFWDVVEATKFTDTPAIVKVLIDHAKEELTEAEIHHAITISCLFHFYNRWVQTHGVAELTDDGYVESGNRLSRMGYNIHQQAPKSAAVGGSWDDEFADFPGALKDEITTL